MFNAGQYLDEMQAKKNNNAWKRFIKKTRKQSLEDSCSNPKCVGDFWERNFGKRFWCIEKQKMETARRTVDRDEIAAAEWPDN